MLIAILLLTLSITVAVLWAAERHANTCPKCNPAALRNVHCYAPAEAGDHATDPSWRHGPGCGLYQGDAS